MAIYHLSVKAISRSAGRSATAAAAYRAGCKIADERTGEIHDYTRKRGVESADLVLPDGAPEWASHRLRLWNAAELAEKRKDACVAREFEVALPSELSPAERRRLAVDFVKDMANRERCAVDVPALKQAAGEAVGASVKQFLDGAADAAVQALGEAAKPVNGSLSRVLRAAGEAESSMRRAGAWFAWKRVAVAGGGAVRVCFLAYASLAWHLHQVDNLREEKAVLQD